MKITTKFGKYLGILVGLAYDYQEGYLFISIPFVCVKIEFEF